MTAVKVITLGLSSIKTGAIAQDGGMGQTLAALGYTYEDTAKMTQEDPTVTEFYAEEVDDPVAAISRAGKTGFEFSIMNPDVSVLADLMGGTADTTNNTWTAPDTVYECEKSVEITPKQGFKIEVPRMKLQTKINAEFSKKGIMLIEVKGTVMAPTKSGEKKIKLTKL